MKEFFLNRDCLLAGIYDEVGNWSEDSIVGGFPDLEKYREKTCTVKSASHQTLLDLITQQNAYLSGFNAVRRNSKVTESDYNGSVFLMATILFAFYAGFGQFLLFVTLYCSFYNDWGIDARLQVLLNKLDQLDKVIFISVRYIQEMETVSRGYRVSNHTPPLERLERCSQIRTGLELRKRLLQSSQMVSNFISIEDNYDENYDLASIKAAIINMRQKEISMFYKWMAATSTSIISSTLAFEIDHFISTVAKAEEDLHLALEFLSHRNQNNTSLLHEPKPRFLDKFHYQLHHIHATALVFQEESNELILNYMKIMSESIADLQATCMETIEVYAPALTPGQPICTQGPSVIPFLTNDFSPSIEILRSKLPDIEKENLLDLCSIATDSDSVTFLDWNSELKTTLELHASTFVEPLFIQELDKRDIDNFAMETFDQLGYELMKELGQVLKLKSKVHL